MSRINIWATFKARIKNSSLISSSLNLMISAGVTALFGFVFWTVVAHTFRSEIVGLATTLLAMSSLLSMLSLTGFDTVFVRYLPKSKNRNAQINGGLLISALASVVISCVFCLLIPLLSPKLLFVDHNIWHILGFALVTMLTTWNTLTNAVLVAYKRSSLVVVINIVFSAVKMSLPFLIHSGGPLTIFMFAGIAQAVNVFLSIAAMIRYFDYKPSLKINLDVLKKTRRYGTAVYIANILNLLPDSALPLIVIDKIGSAAGAYFYIAFTVANLLYTVSFATTQALLAEASHDEKHFTQYLSRGLAFVYCLIVPGVILLVAIAPLILNIFGHGYSVGSVGILRLLSLSGILVVIYSFLSTAFKFAHNFKAMLTVTAINAVFIITLSLGFARRWGLDGIGWAWLIGTFIAVVTGLFFYKQQLAKTQLNRPVN